MNYNNLIAEKINLKNFKITRNSSTFIVGEISANHGGNLKNVFKSIDFLKKIGADAIKIQSYEASTITINSRDKAFYIDDKSIWKGRYLFDLYKKAQTPFSWHKKIFDYAKRKKLICFSSPFDKSSVDLLEKLDCPIYKVASAEIQDLDLINYIARKKKPIIISTGIANIKEIKDAINECLKVRNNKVILLNCISSYPAKITEVNVKYINTLKKYANIVGFSDHTNDCLAAIGSVCLGAKIIEKHFILNNKIKSPDNSFSMNKQEFKDYVFQIRNTEKVLGKEEVDKKKILKGKLKTLTRSLYFIKDLKKGEIIQYDHIKSFRPGIGIKPNLINMVIGKKLKRNVKKFTPIHKQYI
jgi:pseudaminic acid synthase|tara:strand:- start:7113 stop:8180 length:1068 start_codon:yes stop_codon:yes gene_type:complete